MSIERREPMLRLLVVFTAVLPLVSAATQTAAQEEEPCTAVEGALAATPGTSPTAYPAGSPMTSPTTEPNGSPTGSPTVTTTASPTVAESCTVEISGFAFNPANITVTVGTTVTWTNKDVGAPHTATADDQDPGTGQPFFDIDLPNQNDSGSHTFDTAGDFTYHCEVHPFMTGSVKVT
jgi:plastocyanin